MAIYMPPVCRKKKVLDKYNPDTFRVISVDAENTHLKSNYELGNQPSEWRRIWLENTGLALPDIRNRKTEVLPRSVPDYRLNKPHPVSCGFLRHNVRLLNEPICSVYTEITRDEQCDWWPSRVSDEPLKVPPQTNDTIYRADFDVAENSPVNYGSQRHSANPNTEPALGSVPVNFLRARDGKQRLVKEKMSYEHQYNSRIDPNYPIRGKRHGSFVWDQMSKDASNKFVNHYRVISAEEGARRQEQIQSEQSPADTKQVTEHVKTTTGEINQDSNCAPGQKVDTITEESKPAVDPATKGSPKNAAPRSPKRKSSRQNSSSQQQRNPAKNVQEIQSPPDTKNLQEQLKPKETQSCTE